MKRYLPIVTFVGLLLTQPAWAELPQCSAVVQAANQELAKLNKKTVQDDKKLTALLKTLNRDDVLPADYVTRDQAIKLAGAARRRTRYGACGR